jgi:predicted RNA methylase
LTESEDRSRVLIPRPPRCQHLKAKIGGGADPKEWFCPQCSDSWKSDPLDRYYTGPDLASKIVDWALRTPPGFAVPPAHTSILEPSAGDGAFVRALIHLGHQVDAVEIDQQACKALRGIHAGALLSVEQADFLKWKGGQYGLCIMNPPYSHPDGADGRHVAKALRHAFRVVALVRANFLHGFTRWHQVFRWARLTRQVILCRRPPFYGPADAGHTARHDYTVIELVRLGIENRPELGQATELEWWV